MNYRSQEILGILLCVLAVFVLLSFLTYNPLETPSGLSPAIAKQNIMGIFGIYTSYYLMKFTFGWGTLFLPLVILISGYTLFTRREWKTSLRISGYLAGLGIWVSIFLAWIGQFKGGMWEAEFPGIAGYLLWNFLAGIFGLYAAIIILLVVIILLMSGILHISIYDSARATWEKLKDKGIKWKERRRLDKIIVHHDDDKSHGIKNGFDAVDSEVPDALETDLEKDLFKPDVMEEVDEPIQTIESDNESIDEESLMNDILEEEINIDEEKDVTEGDLDAEKERQSRYRQYKLPTLEYLNDPIEIKNPQSEEDLKGKANQLIHALETFGVSGRVVRISPGPVITLFEIEPAEGVRVNKFTNLSDDLARVMRAQRVRIIAPIPGSKSVGVELPNDNPSTVYLKNIINSEQFIQSQSKLSISLGKTTT